MVALTQLLPRELLSELLPESEGLTKEGLLPTELPLEGLPQEDLLPEPS